MGHGKIFSKQHYVSLWFFQPHLCEQGFFSLLYIKNKQRNRLNPSDDMRLALINSIVPRIPQLVKETCPNKSH